MATKIRAFTSGEPTREIALLMAEATPALLSETDVISAVVNGATMMVRPMPNTMSAGRKSTK